MTIGAVVCAFADYGRFPDKALQLLGGESLLQIAVRKLLRVTPHVAVVTSTRPEDMPIRDQACAAGAIIVEDPMRGVDVAILEGVRALDVDYAFEGHISMPFFDIGYARHVVDVAREHPGYDRYTADPHVPVCTGVGSMMELASRRLYEFLGFARGSQDRTFARLAYEFIGRDGPVSTARFGDFLETTYYIDPFEFFGVREIHELYIGTPYHLARARRIVLDLGHIPDDYADLDEYYLRRAHLD